MASFNLAINTATEDNSEAKPATIKITAAKKLADKSIQDVFPGDLVLVEGKLYTKTIENRMGQKQKIPYIQATNIRVIKEKEPKNPEGQPGLATGQAIQGKNDKEEDEIPF